MTEGRGPSPEKRPSQLITERDLTAQRGIVIHDQPHPETGVVPCGLAHKAFVSWSDWPEDVNCRECRRRMTS